LIIFLIALFIRAPLSLPALKMCSTSPSTAHPGQAVRLRGDPYPAEIKLFVGDSVFYESNI
jgi:hypothetical protein